MKKTRFRFTKEQLAFLATVYLYRNARDLTTAFNAVFGTDRTEGQIKSALSNHRITCGRAQRDRLITHSRLLTADQVKFLRKHYRTHSLAAVTAMLNDEFGETFSEQQIKTYTGNHGIRSGRTGCFEKGQKPWNTGTKGMTHGSCTSFRKGNVPANRKPLGHERICSKDGYVLVKVAEENPYTGAPTRYKQKHVHVWEQAHGPVPDGMVVAFRDGNKLNITPENLMLRSRSEMLRLNQRRYNNAPDAIKPSILALTKLEVKMFSAARRENIDV